MRTGHRIEAERRQDRETFHSLKALALALWVGSTLCASVVCAQPALRPPAQIAVPSLPNLPPPALMVRVGDRSQPLKIRQVDIEAQVVGHLSQTTMTLTFFNPNPRVMEGDLYFPLPEGAAVAGYALDIDGVMVDGVVVGKDRARQVFEAEVRKGVDPGLVEWSGGSNFKTRVFPIPAKGTRTVRVQVVANVGVTEAGSFYHLPLAFRDPVDRFSLRVEVVKAALAPVIAGGGPAGLKFGRARDTWVAQARLTDARLTEDLFVALPSLQQRPVQVQRGADGQYTFAIRDTLPAAVNSAAAEGPSSVAVYWDASASRTDEVVGRELEVLQAWLTSLGSAEIALWLVVFRDRAQPPRRFALPADRATLLDLLRAEPRDGGTQLGAVRANAALAKVDLNLLFSDGVSNFGQEEPSGLAAPVYAINAATTANHAALRHIAMRSGGAYFNLQRLTPEAAAAGIGQPVFGFIAAQGRGFEPHSVRPSMPTPVHGSFDLAGRLTADRAEITLSYGYGRRVTLQRTFTLERAEASTGDLLARHHAQKTLDDLLIFPERNRDAIAALGRAHGIVTPGTSLLVLERLEQYVQYGVRPPAGLAAMRKAWDAHQERTAAEGKQQEASKLAHILALWQARVTWWHKRFEPVKIRKPSVKMAMTGAGRGAAAAPRMEARAFAADEGDREESAAGFGGGGMAMGAAEAPMQRSLAAKRKLSEPAPREATIVLKPWDPQTPYLVALRALPAGAQYPRYLAQRAQFGTAPAFFLDCAHHFRAQGRPDLALRVLSNLAELELENPALLRVLAHQLARTGELDLAAGVFERVVRLRPEEPQSFRDLALVLAQRADRDWKAGGAARAQSKADYQRALSLLAQVVMQTWDRFDEIEVIALTELNDILPRARRAGAGEAPVDKRLIQQLDLDLRIVMSWDADQTDMDLHVVEPSGEEAYYSNNRTQIGGLVSRDFTRGYGPEVYAIRRAMPGKYVVRTKFFGASAARLAGAVTLQVDIYTHYGRPDQKRRSVTLRLTEEKETFTVAEVGL